MNTKNIALVASLLIVLSSCEKVIDLDLESTEPQLVIESVMELGIEDISVRITRSGDYFDSSALETVSDAVVTLSDDAGLNLSIPYDSDGYYRTQHMLSVGRTYMLSVAVDGNEYMATSMMLEPVEIITLGAQYVEESTFFDEGYNVFTLFSDPIGEANFFRLIHSINGEQQLEADDLQVVDDRIINGGTANMPIFGVSFLPADTVTIELIHINEDAYDYYNAWAAILGEGGGPGASAAPANPNNNWIGGDVLGYFTTTSSSEQTIILPE